MRKVISFIVKCVLIALLAVALVVFAPGIRGLLGGLVPGAGIIETTQLTHELQEMGVLTAQKHTDTGVFVSTLPAIIIGTAQKVTVPYEYTISYGVDLEKATISAVDDGLLLVSLPPAEMVHDAMRVTGEVEVFDLLYPLTEARYQEILDTQAEAFRQAYLEEPGYALVAWETAKEKVSALLEAMLDAQGARETWSIMYDVAGMEA